MGLKKNIFLYTRGLVFYIDIFCTFYLKSFIIFFISYNFLNIYVYKSTNLCNQDL